MLKNIIKELLNRDDVLPSITIEITTACNLKCVHCYIENRNENNIVSDLKLSDIKNIIDDLKELNVLSVTLTGGEPLMHPQFYDIIKFLKEENFIVNIMSNITLINNKNIKTIERYVDSISTTLYGFSINTYNTVTRCRDGYQRYCRAKNLLLSSTIQLKERGILLNENKYDFINYISSNIATEMHISNSIESPYAAPHRIDKQTNICYYYELIKHNNDNVEDPIEAVPLYICNACVDSLFIKANGDINVCANLNVGLGNIKNTSIKDIVLSGVLKEKRELFKFSNFKKCYNCDQLKFNPVICPANNQDETGCMFTPSKYSCDLCHAVHTAYNMYVSEKSNEQ